MPLRRPLALACIVALFVAPSPVRAQVATASTAAPSLASRKELEERARALDAGREDSLALTRDVQRTLARQIRARLESGDFQAGDRVFLAVRGDSAFSDTVSVSTARDITVFSLPPISVAGVLRSELQAHMRTALARYLRTPDVRVVPLVRIAVLGEVRNPGFYAVPGYELLSDAMMGAGGPTGAADLRRVVVRRGGESLFGSAYLERAIAAGWTLDQLDLRSGDALVVGTRPQRNLAGTIAIATSLLGIAVAVITLSRD